MQFLEDAFRGKLQNPSTLAHSLERIVIFIIGALDLTSLGGLSRDLWSDRCDVFAFESFRVLVRSMKSDEILVIISVVQHTSWYRLTSFSKSLRVFLTFCFIAVKARALVAFIDRKTHV